MRIAGVLTDLSIASFVLQYRPDATLRDWPDSAKKMVARIKDWIDKPGEGLRSVERPFPMKDEIATVQFARACAATWRVDAAKAGTTGFSASARTTLHVATDVASVDRTVFSTMLYSSMEAVRVPSDALPAFVAKAPDDPLSGCAGYGHIGSSVFAHRPIEFRAFQRVRHNFGPSNLTDITTGRIDGLFRWLALDGFGKTLQ